MKLFVFPINEMLERLDYIHLVLKYFISEKRFQMLQKVVIQGTKKLTEQLQRQQITLQPTTYRFHFTIKKSIISKYLREREITERTVGNAKDIKNTCDT